MVLENIYCSGEPILEFRGPTKWLSNFQACYVQLDGKTYSSTEHAYQAAKTINEEERDKVRAAPRCGTARKLGQLVTYRDGWENIKNAVMLDLLRQKFAQEPFKSLLLATGDVHLEEGNQHGDKYWGTVNGEGLNWLGKLLMQVRAELRQGD